MLLVEIGPFDPEIRITDVLIHLYGMFCLKKEAIRD
jgi:hypothetical protein